MSEEHQQTEQQQTEQQQSAAVEQTQTEQQQSTEQQQAAAETATAVKPDESWQRRRLDQQTAKLRDEQQKTARLEQELADAKAAIAANGAGARTVGFDETEVERRANIRATELAAQQQFTNQITKVETDGRAAYPDFDAKIRGSFIQLVDAQDPTSAAAYNLLLQAAIETGEAPKLLYALANDMNEASRILALPPVRMGVELARMAAKPEQQLSAVARPLVPVGQHGPQHLSISPSDPDRADQLSTATWMERRNKEIEARARR